MPVRQCKEVVHKLSHDMRTQLNVISAVAQLLEIQDNLTQSQKNMLIKAQNAVNTATSKLEAALDEVDGIAQPKGE